MVLVRHNIMAHTEMYTGSSSPEIFEKDFVVYPRDNWSRKISFFRQYARMSVRTSIIDTHEASRM